MPRYPDWLLSLPPRQAQLEALSRSYFGLCTQDSVDGPVFERPVPGHPYTRPAKGWAHLLQQRVGKTPTLLAEFCLLRRDFDALWCIVLAPAAYKRDWPLEAVKFGCPFDSYAFDSSDRKGASKWIAAHAATGGLISINYEALKSKDNIALLRPIVGLRTLLAADESVSIQNRQAQSTRAALDLSKEAGWKRILSGKPAPEGPHSLWPQLRFISQIEGVDPVVFRNTFCQIGGFQGRQVKGVKNEDQLHAIFERCSFSGRKSDWLKTPGTDYAEHRVFLAPDQQRLYDAMQQDFMVELANGTIVASDQIVTKLLKMAQISSGFILDEDGRPHDLVPLNANPKIAEIGNLVRNEIDGKTIVVCHYSHTMDTMEKALQEFGVAVIRSEQWHIKNGRDRIEEKDRFNNDPDCSIMLGQEQALRYGHTLLGSDEAGRCRTTIIAESSYSLNDRSQVEERNQGVGQDSPVTIIDLICTDQDRLVIQALQRKEDIAATLLRYARSEGILPGART